MDAAISEATGTLTVRGGMFDEMPVSFEVTTPPPDTAGATCPNHQPGPCSGPMWQSSNAPMTVWVYGGANPSN